MAGHRFDAVVLGGGVAGAAVAASLAPRIRVLLLEKEARLGAHASGRSTGMYIPSYGGPVVRTLAEASRPFLERPPAEIGDALVRPRPVLHFGPSDHPPPCGKVRPLTPREARDLCPVLRSSVVGAAWLEEGTGELDAARLHQGLIAMASRRGAAVWLGTEAHIVSHDGEGWRLRLAGEEIVCRAIVNATGAWADETAGRAGLPPLGLTSYRRTVVLVEAPPRSLDGPIVKHLGERLYIRPFGAQWLVCPADETACAPEDAVADEAGVALAMARLGEMTTHAPPHVSRRWAGLRTFAPDRLPLVGWDGRAPGFFWMAGLGGFGLQTAPALGALAAAAFFGETPAGPPDLAGVLQALSPARRMGRPAPGVPAHESPPNA
ncbi:MAG: NAD(P)/FAD-dependent oxidoreductase [Phenylobacterium sp.]|uniref:NAD(P)/FAD-dependent oxidoreductase n=1 Tax=Phenylobacterium sp. TaxID=1871053 RepID=UPI003918E0A1